MKWVNILKNISITSQRGKTKEIKLPPKEKPEEDCLEWFRKLFYLIQGDDIIEPNMDIQPFREYTNEKLWCPLKNGIKIRRAPSEFEQGVTSFIFESQVILSGERVNFRLSVDVPEANKTLKDLPDTTFYIFFEMTSTSNRMDVLFFQAATSAPNYEGLRWRYKAPPQMKMKEYQEISRKIMLYMKEALS